MQNHRLGDVQHYNAFCILSSSLRYCAFCCIWCLAPPGSPQGSSSSNKEQGELLLSLLELTICVKPSPPRLAGREVMGCWDQEAGPPSRHMPWCDPRARRVVHTVLFCVFSAGQPELEELRLIIIYHMAWAAQQVPCTCSTLRSISSRAPKSLPCGIGPSAPRTMAQLAHTSCT